MFSYNTPMHDRTHTERMPHDRRDVPARRPIHITRDVQAGLPSLRQPAVLASFRSLVGEAAGRGVRTVAFALMSGHIHWVVIPQSREALADATRYVFGQLARRLNKLWGRRGRIFPDRYHSTAGRTACHAWQMVAYVLRNPAAAHIAPPDGRLDPFLGADEALLCTEPFLRSVFGLPLTALRRLLRQMAHEAVPFVPLRRRLQALLQVRLPGFELVAQRS